MRDGGAGAQFRLVSPSPRIYHMCFCVYVFVHTRICTRIDVHTQMRELSCAKVVTHLFGSTDKQKAYTIHGKSASDIIKHLMSFF